MDIETTEQYEQILEELKEKIMTNEALQSSSIADGIIERSYFNNIKKEEEELGEERIGEVSLALSIDQNNYPILTIASTDESLVDQVQDALRKPHQERPAIIELPDEDRDRVARIESVNVLSYLQKREKERNDEIERLRNYESEISTSEQ